MAGEKRFVTPSPRLLRPSKAGGGWSSKWAALIVVLIASVMLLYQTEVSMFSMTGSSESRQEKSLQSYYKPRSEEKTDPSNDRIESEAEAEGQRRITEEIDRKRNLEKLLDFKNEGDNETETTDKPEKPISDSRAEPGRIPLKDNEGKESNILQDNVIVENNQEADGNVDSGGKERNNADDKDEPKTAEDGDVVADADSKGEQILKLNTHEGALTDNKSEGNAGNEDPKTVEDVSADSEKKVETEKPEENQKVDSELSLEEKAGMHVKPDETDSLRQESKDVKDLTNQLDETVFEEQESQTDPKKEAYKRAATEEAGKDDEGADDSVDSGADSKLTNLQLLDSNGEKKLLPLSKNGSEEAGALFKEGADPGRERRSARFSRCFGRNVYIYDLPSMFNADYVANCKHIHKTVSFCKPFSNAGMGRPAQVKHSRSGPLELIPRGTWFETDQFSLEITFHARMLEYPCLTNNPERATVFYVPFFAGLAIFRSLYEADPVEKDRHAKMVLEWLEKLPYWHRHHGRDHLFLVSRVLIDFTQGLVHNHWGNTFMRMSHMLNATVLSIEVPKHHAIKNAMSVPYPISFHPRTDEDIRVWQRYVRGFSRKYRIAFGGVGHGMGASIRRQLQELCLGAKSPHCKLFHCAKRVCFRPHNVMWHYMNAHFCFQPPGDTPTRKGMFDCMLAGGIPVLFHEHTAFRYFWHLPADHTQYSVFHHRNEFWKDNGTSILEKLKAYSAEEIEKLRENVIQLIPNIVYAMPGESLSDHRDAFQISLEKVVQKVSKLMLPGGHPRLPKPDWD